jgi:arsenite methyltransferase
MMPAPDANAATPMTKQRVTPRRRGSYGIDAPYGPAFMAAMAVFYLVMAIISPRWQTIVPGTFVVALLAFYLHGTLRAKFVVWAGLLDQLHLRGDERILDLGCGRGAVLLMAAQHLTTGRAVGVDLWRSLDQSGNSLEATQRNAIAEGVADKVELHTANMTALPFADGSFDVVVSSLAIHNISKTADREKAIEEAARVLRPGGRLLIADVRATRQYQEKLTRIGMNELSRRRLPWGPWYLVTATKPEHPPGEGR